MSKAYVYISGGLVQSVMSYDKNLRISIIDQDVLDDYNLENEFVDIPDDVLCMNSDFQQRDIDIKEGKLHQVY